MECLYGLECPRSPRSCPLRHPAGWRGAQPAQRPQPQQRVQRPPAVPVGAVRGACQYGSDCLKGAACPYTHPTGLCARPDSCTSPGCARRHTLKWCNYGAACTRREDPAHRFRHPAAPPGPGAAPAPGREAVALLPGVPVVFDGPVARQQQVGEFDVLTRAVHQRTTPMRAAGGQQITLVQAQAVDQVQIVLDENGDPVPVAQAQRLLASAVPHHGASGSAKGGQGAGQGKGAGRPAAEGGKGKGKGAEGAGGKAKGGKGKGKGSL